MRIPRLLPLLVVAAVALAGCASSSPAADPTDDSAYVFRVSLDRLAGISRAPSVYRSIDELLGNVSFRVDGGRARPVTDLAVVGSVVAVDDGYGFVPVERGQAPAGPVIGDGARVAFDDPRALWRTLHLRVRVDEVLSGSAKTGQVIEVGMSIGDAKQVDAARFARGMHDIGRAVWFLERRSPVFAYDRALLSNLRDGELITLVGDGGKLSTPFGDADGGGPFVAPAPTLAALRETARAADRVIEVTASRNGVPQR